jgi:hypothetical protein
MRAPYASGATKDIRAYWRRYGKAWRERNPNYMREYLKKYHATYSIRPRDPRCPHSGVAVSLPIAQAHLHYATQAEDARARRQETEG